MHSSSNLQERVLCPRTRKIALVGLVFVMAACLASAVRATHQGHEGFQFVIRAASGGGAGIGDLPPTTLAPAD